MLPKRVYLGDVLTRIIDGFWGLIPKVGNLNIEIVYLLLENVYFTDILARIIDNFGWLILQLIDFDVILINLGFVIMDFLVKLFYFNLIPVDFLVVYIDLLIELVAKVGDLYIEIVDCLLVVIDFDLH